MAESKNESGLRNVKLLVIAGVIALLAVIGYNVSIQQAAEEARGETVRVLQYTEDLDIGEELTADSVAVKEVSKTFAGNLGKVIVLKEDESAGLVVGMTLARGVKKGRWAFWDDVRRAGGKSPLEGLIDPTKVGVPLEIDPRLSPGEILQIGDRINLVGQVSIGGRPVQHHRLIEGVKVVSIGGRGLKSVKVGAYETFVSSSAKQYRSITVEIDRDESLAFQNLLSQVQGNVKVELLNPNARRGPNWGKINPALKSLAEAAQPVRPGSGPGDAIRDAEDWENR